jgi:hypothetical protein
MRRVSVQIWCLRENLIKKKCELFLKHTSPALRGNLKCEKISHLRLPEISTEAEKLPLGNLAKVFMMWS